MFWELPLRVRAVNRRRCTNGWIRMLIVLSTPIEIREAEARLRLLDRQDRGLVVRQDLPSRSSVPSRDVRSSAQPIIVVLHAAADWPGLLFRIEEMYSFGRPCSQPTCPRETELFTRIDANEDGSWEPAEIAKLLDVAADFDLHINGLATSTTLRSVTQPDVMRRLFTLPTGQRLLSCAAVLTRFLYVSYLGRKRPLMTMPGIAAGASGIRMGTNRWTSMSSAWRKR